MSKKRRINYDDFLTILRKSSKMKCEAAGALEGINLYHIMGIHDDRAVVMKYYNTRSRDWKYFIREIKMLYGLYTSGWIDLRR